MITENLNFLTSAKFKAILTFDTKNIEFALQTINIPSISANNPKQNFRNKPFYFPGDTIEYNPLSLNFIITENMENYSEIYNWTQSVFSGELENSDITILILDSHFKVIGKFVFNNVIPSGTPSLELTNASNSHDYLTGSFEILYDRYEFIKS
jgi:hypothetical protein